MAPQIRTAALSIPRGNGKSWLAARILTHELRKRVKNVEYDLCATSIEQARAVFGFVQGWLGETDRWGKWIFTDSTTRLGARFDHTRGGRLIGTTKLKVLSSNAKTAMGLVRCPLVVADEPASWEVVGGRKMHDAIQTAQGKPGSPLRVIYIGTLELTAGWWAELIEHGSHGATYVQVLKARKKKWDQISEVRRVNPLKWWDPISRAVLLDDLKQAKKSERLKARFCSLQLNVPTHDSTDVLLTVEDWEKVITRDVAPRGEHDPIIGVDMGGRRAWSAAVAIWPSTLRTEAFALCGGELSVDDMEDQDLVHRGTYQRLVDNGSLIVAAGKRQPPVSMLVDEVFRRWGNPSVFIADRFRFDALEEDVEWRAPVEARRLRWSESTEDIDALERLAVDGGLSVDPISQAILAHSIEQAVIEEDAQNNIRLVKRNTRTQRDDVASAWVLAAGAVNRFPPLAPIRVY